MHIKTSLSTLESYSSVEEFLKVGLGLSRNQIKKYRLPKKFLNKDLKPKDLLELPFDLINSNCISPSFEGSSIELIHEDKNFLVFNKPYGIHGHPQSYSDCESLLNFMRSSEFGKYLSINSNQYERGLLFRLDKVTSGVLVYVKEPALYDQLRNSFNKIAKKKIYLAVAKGNFSEVGTHQHYFSPSGKNSMKMNALASGEGQLGQADFSKVQYDSEKNLSLIRISLLTGLRHQIRSQLSALGFPIHGDELYGGAPAERVYLHAYLYALKWDAGELEIKAKNAPLFDGLISLDFDSIL